MIKLERNYKIGLLIAFQICLIFASFIVLTHFESHRTLIGNSINISGKNRFLTERVISEMTYNIQNNNYSPDTTVQNLWSIEENLNAIRYGGTVSDIAVPPLSPKLIYSWNNVYGKFNSMKSKILQVYESTPDHEVDFSEIYYKRDLVVEASDSLTNGIAKISEQESLNSIKLQVFLAIGNIVAHLVLILYIFKLLDAQAQRSLVLERFATVGELSARIAHDLRNPLSIAKNSIELLKMRTDANGNIVGSADELARINRALKRMTHQVNDVLDYLRVSPLNLRANNLTAIVRSAVERVGVPQSVRVKIIGADIMAECDFDKMEVVFSNLISNAIQAMENRGELHIRTLEGREGYQIIEFEDKGPGIPTNLLAKIFDPLFTTKQQGTGLGLVTCKNIVEQHHGMIEVKTQPGKWTMFRIKIPKKQHKQ